MVIIFGDVLIEYLQAASGLENLKMADSPAKKINFDIGKENVQHNAPVVEAIDLKDAPVEIVQKVEKPKAAPTLRPEEADEPLLQENPHRFVLFPIKYHEVGQS